MESWKNSFFITLAVIFVLLVHNGFTPLYIIALFLLPFFIPLFYRLASQKVFLSLSAYLILFGFLGRYERYLRQNYASDVLLVTKDFIGLLLSGKNPYNELIYMANGLAPFLYLPFELFWYLPARLIFLDLRFFEAMVSVGVPVLLFLFIRRQKFWAGLPVLAVVSLTPFLLDLAADGSNDNSAIFLLLTSIFFLRLAFESKNRQYPIISAIFLGLALSFKHYSFIYFGFLLIFLLNSRHRLNFNVTRYLKTVFITLGLFFLPFVLTAPGGFWRSLSYIDSRPGHAIWGWNLWVVFESYWQFVPEDYVIQAIRILAVLLTIIACLKFLKINRLDKVLSATVLTIFVYLFLSKWTSYAYFTFVVPLVCLNAVFSLTGEKKNLE